MKLQAFVVSFVLLALTAGCSKNPQSVSSGNGQTDLPFAVAKSAAVARDSSAVDSSLTAAQVRSNNMFAVAMYKQLINGNSNLFFSPYSIAMALAMADAGASGTTDAQMRQALSDSLSGDDFFAAMNAIDLSIGKYAKLDPSITLNMVNSTWCQSGWDFRISYLDKLSRYFGAGVNLLDFVAKPEDSRVVINTWVAGQTNQKILNLLPQGSISGLTRLVLTNAIYFSGMWTHEFDATLTKNMNFYTGVTASDLQYVTAPIMQLGKTDSTIKMQYSDDGISRLIDLPYSYGRLTMTVLLPDLGQFQKIESELTYDQISQLIAALDSTKVPPVLFPKFQFTTASLSLVPALKALGMNQAFIDSADFSGIDGRHDLYMSDVMHKAFISVDENGTEAAAATGVVINTVGMERKAIFYANHPFIFMIRDKQTKAILFMGRVMNPTITG